MSDPRYQPELLVRCGDLFRGSASVTASGRGSHVTARGLRLAHRAGRRRLIDMDGDRVIALHLDETSYPTKPGLPSPYAHGYMLLGKPPATDVTGLSPSLAPGSGGIVSTVEDIADFYRALLSGHVLRPAGLKAMKTLVSERTGKSTAGSGYGLGIARLVGPCVGWGHSGELPGYDVSPAFSEDARHQVVLMINHDARTLPKRAFALYNRLYVKAFCG